MEDRALRRARHMPPPDGRGQAGWPWDPEPAGSEETRGTLREVPRITVVTPSLNQGAYLEEAIRSVLSQGYPNLEYVVMDGGSTDGTGAILAKYSDVLDRVESGPDGGQSAAINCAFEGATGDILCWLNSDDLLAEGALWAVATRLGGRARAMLIGDSGFFEESWSGVYQPDRRRPTWVEMAYDARTFPQPSVFWTADLWRVAGPLDENLFFAMDYDLWLRMRPLAHAEIYLDRVLSITRIHPRQKGRLALQEGREDEFANQRAFAAVRAARARGETRAGFLARIWWRRVRQAIRSRRASMVTGSSFHRAALRAALRGQATHSCSIAH
jgi:glycosyltransferase involved in cell wall biosynthesis